MRYQSWYALFAQGLILALLFIAPVQASVDDPLGKRLALVVGNSKYQSVYSLKNAVNDSHAVTEVLKRLGFEVISLDNAGGKEFRKAIDEFSRKAKGADATVFYFSGHGFQLKGANYLVPTDASLKSADAIEKETLRLDTIISELQARDRQTLIFLDACRNNPLPESMRDKSNAEGLAQIETGSGTFVAFATQPGNITRDGAGDNSPFTLALLEHIETPGISISDMMIRVRNTVEETTLREQTPWDQSSLRSQFYFKPQGEGDEALTEDDRELLMSLDPELRKKFEVRFGLKIESVEESEDGSGENAAPEEPLIAHIQPAVSIEAMADEESEPVADQVAVAPDALKPEPKPAEPEPEAIIPNLLIASGDEEEVLPDDTPETVPIPTSRPEEPAEKEVDMAMLEPAPAAPRPLAPVEVDLPPAPKASSGVSTSPQPAEPLPSPGKTESAIAEPVSPQTDAAGRVAPVAVIQPTEPVQDASRAVSAEPDIDLGLKPVVGERIVGEEVAPVAPREDSAAIDAQKTLEAEKAAPPAKSNLPVPAKPDVDPGLKPVVGERVVGEEVAPVAPGEDSPAVDAQKTLEAQKSAPPVKSNLPVLIPAPKAVANAPAPVPALVPPPATKEVEPEKQLASIDPNEITPDLIKPLPLPEEDQAADVPSDLPRAIQEQLARLGCYRSSIDGNWGSGSAKALLRYYATKREAPDNLDPNPELLAKLTNEETVVCKLTEGTKPKKNTAKDVVKKPVKDGPKVVNKPEKRTFKTKNVASGEKPKKPKLTGLGAFR